MSKRMPKNAAPLYLMVFDSRSLYSWVKWPFLMTFLVFVVPAEAGIQGFYRTAAESIFELSLPRE